MEKEKKYAHDYRGDALIDGIRDGEEGRRLLSEGLAQYGRKDEREAYARGFLEGTKKELNEVLELMGVKNSLKNEHRHGFGVYFSQKNEHVTKTIADHYGLRHQCRKLREELAELSEALEIHEEKPTASSKEAVLSEIADVVFLIRQIVYKGAIDPEAIEEMIAYKARRQLKRIAKEKQESEGKA